MMNKSETIQSNCYTIGHSNYSYEEFEALLQKHKINCLVDVRSAPYSKYASQFNKETLSASLKASSLTYVFMGDCLGGRCTNESLLFENGTVNYAALSATPSFKEGIAKVIKNISNGIRMALMCAEKNPFDCHRFALISKALRSHGVAIKHILEDGTVVSNEDLEDRLLKKYKKEYLLGQASFLEVPQSREEAIEEAYAHLNKDIAFKFEDAMGEER